MIVCAMIPVAYGGAGAFRRSGVIKRADGRAWFQGPVFTYRVAGKAISVNVTGSSWPISGMKLAEAVTEEIQKFRRRAGHTVLDFGAGSWLRYTSCVRELMPTRDVFAVEYA